MAPFDHAFGLSAVILGLGLAEMALRLQQVVFAGKRVKWAIEPLLFAAIVFCVIVLLWFGAWQDHTVKSFTLHTVALRTLADILPVMAAAAAFPKVPDKGEVDLYAYYDGSRRFLFGTLGLGLVVDGLLTLMRQSESIHGVDGWLKAIILTVPYYGLGPYFLMMFVRWRWLNILALAFVLVGVVTYTSGLTLRD